MNQIQLGPITIDDTVSFNDRFFSMCFWDSRITESHEAESMISLSWDAVKREAEKRGKLHGMANYYSDEDKGGEVNLTFEDWANDVDYREEVDRFIQELVVERLNPFKEELEELRGFKAAHVVKEKVVKINEYHSNGTARYRRQA